MKVSQGGIFVCIFIEIRNIAIIAHVDYEKTTLTDAIMRETHMFTEGESMDTNALEKERGITIYSKNTVTFYKDTKINIIDTPGHADFDILSFKNSRVVGVGELDSLIAVVDFWAPGTERFHGAGFS